MPGAFLDSFSWPAKQAHPMDGVSNPDSRAINVKTTFQVVFLFAIPTGSNLLRPPVCREQTGTAPLARQGEYQDDTSSTQDSRLGRSEATPDRARYMDVPSQS